MGDPQREPRRSGRRSPRAAEIRTPGRLGSPTPKPPADSADHAAELQRLRDELARAKEMLAAGEREFEEVRREADRLRLEAGETRAARARGRGAEDEARGGRPGRGVESETFSDLREALNKKDKEILSLKEHLFEER